MNRYAPVGDWRRCQGTRIVIYNEETGRESSFTVVHEISDLRDSRGGHVYSNGAQRVRVLGGTIPGIRARTFTGETAFFGADNLFRDAVAKAGRMPGIERTEVVQ